MAAQANILEADFDDEVPAPSAEDYRRGDAISGIAFNLTHAGRGHDLAHDISSVLLLLEREALGKQAVQLTTHQRERIMAALNLTVEVALPTPPIGLQRPQMAAGLLLIAHTVQFWALPDEERRAKPRLARYLRDCLRIFRNALHNSCLLESTADELFAANPISGLPAALEASPTLALCGFVDAFSTPPAERERDDVAA